jgi:hypothetical protein
MRHEWPLEDKLSVPVMDIMRRSLSVRASNCIYRSQVGTVGDLMALTTAGIRKWKHAGKHTAAEIKWALQHELGLDLPDPSSPLRQILNLLPALSDEEKAIVANACAASLTPAVKIGVGEGSKVAI